MTRPPNVLFLLTDQHAPRVAGFAGDPVVRTQHLDALADRAVQFDTAICASPVCTPSRMSMMTALEPHRCAAWNNHWVIHPEHVTWPRHMAAHGYHTALIGKMHFGGRDQMQGFGHRPYGDLRHGLGHQPDPIEHFPSHAGAGAAGPTQIPESLLQDVVVTRESLAHILELHHASPDQPWFVCASYQRPHPPYTAPGRYIRRYRGKLEPLNVPADIDNRLDPYARHIKPGETGDQLTDEQTMRAREAYYASVDFVDDCMGELIDGLSDAGALDNTIIIYTSDHGDMIGQHGLWGKAIYFEPSIGVPLLIAGPGIAPQNARVADPISLMDLFPTVADLCDLPIPDNLDGVDFSALLRDPRNAAPARAFAPSEYFQYGVRVRGANSPLETEPYRAMRAIRTRDWKYVDIEGGDPLLFDMVNDPQELDSRAADPQHADRCATMRAQLFEGFSWQHVHEQLAADRERLPQLLSGQKPSTPNQYMLPDGRIFDAEKELYDARWIDLPDVPGGGIIPQQFG